MHPDEKSHAPRIQKRHFSKQDRHSDDFALSFRKHFGGRKCVISVVERVVMPDVVAGMLPIFRLVWHLVWYLIRYDTWHGAGYGLAWCVVYGVVCWLV